MPPPGSYKIKVLYCYNPHLIWVEVTSRNLQDITYEQIGLYGVLPHVVQLDWTDHGNVGLSSKKCNEWVPAATKLMKEFLKDAKDLSFSPVFIDDRTSLFDDNIQKYGEILKQTSDGEYKKLSECLIQSAFARQNPNEFLNILSSGRLNTKLKYQQVVDVLNHLESQCDIDKLQTMTTVAQKIRSLEDELAALEVNKYDKEYLKIIESEMQVLELSKEVDQASIGRACSRTKRDAVDEPDEPYVIKNYFDQSNTFNSETSESEMTDVSNASDTKKVKNSVMSWKIDLLKKISEKKSPSKERVAEPLLDSEKFLKVYASKMPKKPDSTPKEAEKPRESTLRHILIQETKLDVPETPETNQVSSKITPMQRKLMLLNAAVKSKDSIKGTNDIIDDDIDDVMKHINTAYPNTKLAVDKNSLKQLKDNVQENIDVKTLTSQMCSFVEKIVTPVVMVHSKLKMTINPIYTLRDIPFNKHIHIVLKNMLFQRAMEIQSISWQTILRGHSVFMIGPKESGKTMGYLPCVCRLVSDGTPEILNSYGPISIIVCATAESVTEIEKLSKMLLGVNEKVQACYAGVDDLFITTSLLNGCDLLICTPPILVRLLQDSDFGVDLRRFRTFVLDDYERLDEVYKNEIKFFHHKIKEIEKTKANKELKVQYIVASRIWSDYLGSLAKRAPDTVICIGSFPECVSYSKSNMSVNFVKNSEKVNCVKEFIKEIDESKKVVIVCKHSEEVVLLENELKYLKSYIFACNNDLTVTDLYNINAAWNDYNVPVVGALLICTDENLAHLNITDANYLVHFSLPKTYSFFRRRFSVLKDKYPSIFKHENEAVNVKILLDEENTEKLPKIIHFIKRSTDVPQHLDDMCEKILAAKDKYKAKKLVPICNALLTLGYCPEFYDCLNRHKILNGYDDPPTWLPKSGIITFTILHFHTATNYSARLMTRIENEKETKFPSTYHTLSVKLGMYFGKASNRKLHGIPKIGDICAVSTKQDLFARCQVVKILTYNHRGHPQYILIKLLDEEKYERTKDIYLYHLPKDLAVIDTFVVQIRLANVQPRDKDVTFSELARDHIKKLVTSDDDLHVRGRIAAVVGNCVFLDTLEACRELSSLEETVVKYDLKNELLEKHAENYPEHINKLKELCKQNNYSLSKDALAEKSEIVKKTIKGYWAHLTAEELSGVYVTSVLSPDQFFIRLSKFDSCMNILIKDIKKYVDTKPERPTHMEVGDIVLAKFPDDDIYERARIDAIDNKMVKCFFVDQGDWNFIPVKDILPITDKLINQLPFQCIECRLVGITPPGNEWTEFCNNWLSNYTDEGTKIFYAKYFTKETAKFTAGNKYSIGLVDTNSTTDIIINQLMIDLNLAHKLEDEIKYLDDILPTNNEQQQTAVEDEWENVSDMQNNASPRSDAEIPLSKIFPPKPIRSVPLVTSDAESESSDQWDIQKPSEFAKIFKLMNAQNDKKPANEARQMPNLLSLTTGDSQSDNSNDYQILSGSQVRNSSDSEMRTSSGFQMISKDPKNELDSDDTTSQSVSLVDVTRKPKLIWRQNKTAVNVKILLIGVEKYKLRIEDQSLSFSTYLNDTKYSFDFDLYAVVNKSMCSHCNKGQYILVKLVKVLQKNWLTLTKDPQLKKWIIYDVEGIDASSDEETVDDSMLKIAKHIHESQETDSDDDDIIDDVEYRYKR